MAGVNLTKATASNWQALVKEAIRDAKSRCGNEKKWNGEKELEAIKKYFNIADRFMCEKLEGSGGFNDKKVKWAVDMRNTIFDAVSEANLEVLGTDSW